MSDGILRPAMPIGRVKPDEIEAPRPPQKPVKAKHPNRPLEAVKAMAAVLDAGCTLSRRELAAFSTAITMLRPLSRVQRARVIGHLKKVYP